MFGVQRSMGIAVLCAVGSVVAAPVGVADAAGAPTAIITGAVLDDGGDTGECAYEYTTRLLADESTDPDGGVLQYEWSDSLGGEASEDGKTFTFTCDDVNEVTLKVTNSAGLSDTATVRLTVNKPPIVEFSPNSGTLNDVVVAAVGESVTFTAIVTDPEGGPIEFGEWVFPDPLSATYEIDSTGSKITFTCWEDGYNNFGLEVFDDFNFRGFGGGTLECRVRPTGAVVPAPAVPGKRTVVPVGTTVEFKPATDSWWMTYAWRTTGTPGIASTKDSFTRTFDTPGHYGVELYETNELGTAKQWVGYTVIDSPTVAVSPAPKDPKARMRVPLGSTVTFDGSGSRSPGGGSLSYRWLTTGTTGVAGDGVTFARKFDQVGNFGVELIVEDELGDTAKRWVGVTVFKSEPPVVSVSPAPKDPKARLQAKVGDTVTFDGRRSRDPDGGALTYEWRSTGVRGIAGKANTYSRKFDKAGQYGVELIVIDDEGQRARRWVGVTVAP